VKKYLKKLLLLFISILSMVALSGCKKEQETTSPLGKVDYGYFDTVSYVYSYGNDLQEEFENTCDEVFAILAKYHKLFDIYYEYEGVNNICTINKNAGIQPIKVDSELIDFLLYCKSIYELTNGENNIMLGSVLKIWHNYRTEAMSDASKAKIPTEEELNEASKHIAIENLIIDKENSTVYINDKFASIDVGAIGKGYATEMAAQYLIKQEKNSYVLNIGGNIRIIGTKPNGSSWSTGIVNPNDKSTFALNITIADTACVTSGIYERYYTVNDIRYHHVIDKDTLWPSEYFSSVTVITPDSALADSLSTALFCMSEQDGRELIQKIGNVDVIWIYADGNIEYTEGVKINNK